MPQRQKRPSARFHSATGFGAKTPAAILVLGAQKKRQADAFDKGLVFVFVRFAFFERQCLRGFLLANPSITSALAASKPSRADSRPDSVLRPRGFQVDL